MTVMPLSDSELLTLLDALAEEDSFVFLETTKVSGENQRSYIFTRPLDRLACLEGDDPKLFLGRAEALLERGFYLAGWLAYEFGYALEPALAAARSAGPAGAEAGRPLAEFGVYKQPCIYDHLRRELSRPPGGTAWPPVWPLPADHAREQRPGFQVGNIRFSQERRDYLGRIERIKSYIEAGDTYQVNYTIKLLFDFAGSAAAFYATLRRNQSVPYAAYIKNGRQRILSFSPELFFRKEGTTITVRPMKGTINRGRTPDEDAELVKFLKNDIKNRSENVMIVDLLRNDLGRLGQLQRSGGVRVKSLFDVETYETLHQMTSTVQGELRPAAGRGLSLVDLFRSLFPCGSVTGAPKIRTMEIIRELEQGRRGVYTGAIGFLAPGGEASFNVPIRTVVLDGARGEMGIGSGIVYDSDPVKEWEECSLKGHFLTRPAPEFKLIETMLWAPGSGYWLLAPHLERLAASARYFGFAMDLEKITELLRREAGSFSRGQRLRLLLAKDGTVEIAARECPLPAAGLDFSLLSDICEAAEQKRPRITFAGQNTDSSSPYLYHKTTIRELYDREREKALAAGFFEVLFCNEKGQVTEGGISNVFIRNGDSFVTPPPACGLLDGVFRRRFLESNPGRVREAILSREDVARAEAVYVANSIRGLVRVGF